jgi:DNA-binding NarL/FixJ family response regulator
VDDNSDFLEAARDFLDREGFEVVGVATTGAQAISEALELRPDLILLDVYLGDESGLSVAQQLAQASGPQGPPVILISTYAERDLADLVAASSAIAFLSKAELSGDAIRGALDRGSG